MELRDRTVVITGASRGLGAGMAEKMHQRGLRLGLCARGEPVLAGKERVYAERTDVTDPEAMERFAAAVEERFGTIDLWINNAGVLEPVKKLRDVEPQEFRRHIDVNVTGVYLGSRAYVRHLRRRGHKGGVLINISSGAGRRAYAGWSAYCAGKAAVDRMTECIRIEEEEIGLRAHAVGPGVIDTDMQTLIRNTSAEDFPMVEKFHEMKRQNAFRTPDQVAADLLALAFDPAYHADEVLVDLRG